MNKLGHEMKLIKYSDTEKTVSKFAILSTFLEQIFADRNFHARNKMYGGDISTMLVEKEELILSEIIIAITFSNFFSQKVLSLELFKLPEVLPNVPRPLWNYDRIDCIVIKYKNHQSIAKMKLTKMDSFPIFHSMKFQ